MVRLRDLPENLPGSSAGLSSANTPGDLAGRRGESVGQSNGVRRETSTHVTHLVLTQLLLACPRQKAIHR